MEIEDEIQQDEKDLAEQLRAVCTPYGDERLSKLKESTDILFRMGKLYLEKTTKSNGMKLKLDFIKCASLLHSARVRYQTCLKDEVKSKEVITVIQDMDQKLLESYSSNIFKIEKSVFSISQNVARKFKYLRKAEKAVLEKLDKIEGNLPAAEFYKKQAKKIVVIRNIMEVNTKNYKRLMQDISSVCLEILGDPPCQYAIVGLGSLARKEMTLYSDFEHVIVLDEAIKVSQDYILEYALEYFRRFTVIFQIIMIGLGETAIRSVGVKSINDLYSEDKTKNWFYDMITPCGVSFDGRVPHSCNTPLGRQETTKDKTHKVELIQPVSVMASYLTTDEHLKNGYYLKDMLTRTCFVYGNEDVYQDFLQIAETITTEKTKKEVATDAIKMVSENYNVWVAMGNAVVGENEKVEVKKLFYRPISALASYIGDVTNLQSTTFDILNAITREAETAFKQIDPSPYVLCYGFAIACEIRLKAYSIAGCNRYRASLQDVYDLVGKHCVESCEKILRSIGIFFHSFLVVKFKNDKSTNIQKSYTEIHELKQISDVALEIMATDFEASSEKIILLKSLEESFTKILQQNVEQQPKSSFMQSYIIAVALLALYLAERDFNKSLDVLKKINELEKRSISTAKSFFAWQNWKSLYFIHMKRVLDCLSPLDVVNYCSNSNKSEAELLQYSFRLATGLSKMKIEIIEGGKELKNLQEDLIKHGYRSMEQSLLINVLRRIFITQFDNQFTDDAFQTLEAVDIILETQMGEFLETSHNLDALADERAVQVYIKRANDKIDFDKKCNILLRAIRLCKIPENRCTCKHLHIDALNILLSEWKKATTVDILLICLLYNESSVEIKTAIHTNIFHVILKCLNTICESEVRGKDSAVTWNLLQKMIDTFSHILLHPILLLQIYPIVKRILEYFDETLLQKEKAFLKTWPIFTNTTKTNAKLDFHHFRKTNRLQIHAQTYWKSLFQSNKNSHKNSEKALLSTLALNVNFPLLDTFHHFFKLHKNYYYINNSKQNQETMYKNGTESFLESDFTAAAKLFWKFLNYSPSAVKLRNRATEMLHHCIIHQLIKSEFTIVSVNGFVGVERRDFAKHG